MAGDEKEVVEEEADGGCDNCCGGVAYLDALDPVGGVA